MKCMSCESEINPKWRYAIDSNICPFCGQNVMDENLKELFSNLRVTMDALLAYPEQLNDWLLSNYEFIQTTSPLLINYVSKDQLKAEVEVKSKHKADEVENAKFTVKVQTDHGEEEIMAEKIQSEERTSSFFKRAEAVKPNIDGFQSAAEKTQRLKSMASQIKRAGTSSMMSHESMADADPEAVAEMQSLMSDSHISSSLPSSDDDEIPSVVLAMANRGGGKGSSHDAADLLKLQQMHGRVSNSHSNFESGENRGKNGFSRAG
jgi:hypothetical protein